ncbi:hypothetical protein Tco_0893566 [Tanacetum coccineum]|uniref:Reverse transcriptase domain-containing protein n=1 Tax=Tanacetum coccineum TaxID=301880 RepID=A0ABQ5CAQ5_9ASTR
MDSPSNKFFMERGLRQGDPLSPFLFLLVVEALQVTILNACDRGLFKGMMGQDLSAIATGLGDVEGCIYEGVRRGKAMRRMEVFKQVGFVWVLGGKSVGNSVRGTWSWRIPPRGCALDELNSLTNILNLTILSTNDCDTVNIYRRAQLGFSSQMEFMDPKEGEHYGVEVCTQNKLAYAPNLAAVGEFILPR